MGRAGNARKLMKDGDRKTNVIGRMCVWEAEADLDGTVRFIL